tara:strand:- start:928 stop:1914 length:987 start_codon:yes stop_codon:yes gene_type:complete
MKLAIVGVTGMVGRMMLKVLEERNLYITEFIAVASKNSKGKIIVFRSKEYKIISTNDLLDINVDLALLAAGSNLSRKLAPLLANKGCRVIDNSSYWRMHNEHKLIIPEINGSILTKNDMIIANPNCSTIQMLMALAPLHKKFIIKRVIVSTYQSTSGTGIRAVTQLENEQIGIKEDMAYHHQIYRNAIPHCDLFEENGYTKEEMKLTNETKKILDKNICVTATAVRIPVVTAHSESINVSFENDFSLEEVRRLLYKMDGVELRDVPLKNIYPMPIHAKDSDSVFVGRIRRDFTQDKTLNMWVVADNLRKGAATNTIQIAEYLLDNKLI